MLQLRRKKTVHYNVQNNQPSEKNAAKLLKYTLTKKIIRNTILHSPATLLGTPVQLLVNT